MQRMWSVRSSAVYARSLYRYSTTLGNKLIKWTQPDLISNKPSPKSVARVLHATTADDVLVHARQCVTMSAGDDGCPRDDEISKNEETKPYSSIPGPKPLPLVGNKLFFTAVGGYPLERYWQTAQRLYEKYGPVVKVANFSGKLDMVLVFRPDDTRKMFQAEGRYPLRPGLGILTHYRLRRPQWFTSPGLVPGNGPEWRRLRSAIHPLLRREVVNTYRPAQTEVANDLILAIASHNESNKKRNEGNMSRFVIPDLLNILFYYTLEAVGIVSMGTRLGCLTSTYVQPTPKSQAQSIIAANAEVLRVLGDSIFLPPLYKLFPTKGYRHLARAQDIISRVVHVEMMRRKEEQAFDPEGFSQRHPFLATLMTNPELSPKDVFLLLVEVFQGGIDATATTLGFCVYFLASDPTVQDKLFKEVQHVQPATHTLQGLPYLRAVVQETLRLRPSASARSRIIQEDAILSGYFVPAGTFVVSPPVVACHDPQIFPNPQTYKPDRWLSMKRGAVSDASSSPGEEEKKEMDGGKIDPYTIVAFGHGARMCPGRRLAEQEIYLALIQLIKSYKMELTHPEMIVGQVMKLNMMPDAPLGVVFSPRT